MQSIIAMELLGAVSENGFSLDELVMETRRLFEEEGMAGVIGLILHLVDEALCLEMVTGKRAPSQCCCDHPRYAYLDRVGRRFRTSAGRLRIRWRRLRCNSCGKTTVPLRDFLGLAPYQSKTAELERMVAEVVSEQSYRRGSRHLELIGQIPVPRSTAHRWIAASDCDAVEARSGPLDVLWADGTGFKRRPDKARGITNQGELRVALGVDKSGRIVPLGAFSGASWDQIASHIQGQRAEDEPVAEMLVSDGERGLCGALGKLCRAQQRCHWHIVHDLDGKLWLDHADKGQRRQLQKRLAAIIGIELPANDVAEARDSDKTAILAARNEADYEVRRLIQTLFDKGYRLAGDYLARAARHLFSYVDRWLETGIVSPRVSSFIERLMRELARRLKRMAFGWSEAGAAKMARIIIKRFTSADQWEAYWKKRLRLQGNVLLALTKLTAIPPQPLVR